MVQLQGRNTGANGGIQARRIAPKSTAQYKSWFAVGGADVYEGHPVVAQIYFPFDESALDTSSDRVVLDALIRHLRYDLSQYKRVELEFVGHADPRGAASYNEELARKRAQKVRDYVQRGVEQRTTSRVPHFLYYKSRVTSLGERFPTGDNMADRRVDIVVRSVTVKQFVSFDPNLITAEYKGPLTRKLQFKGWASGSASLFHIIGGDLVEMEVRDPTTGRSAFYIYTGANVGTPNPQPISVGIPDTGYTDLDLPPGYGSVDIEDFNGAGSVQSEPLRVCRRLQPLRGWSNEDIEELLA
jgi:outer membrane protein OmpA-like peptidoglycan-associated protein